MKIKRIRLTGKLVDTFITSSSVVKLEIQRFLGIFVFRIGGNKMERRPFRSGPREMHKATCADCGAETEVPFKPAEGRPVYCRECFAKRRPRRPRF